MKRIYIYPIFLSCVILSSCASRMAVVKDYDFSRIQRVGVLDFVSYGEDYHSGAAVSDAFVRQLMRRGIQVIERSRMRGILQEINLSRDGYISPETSKKMGRIYGVDALIMGTVRRYLPERYDVIYFTNPQTGRVESQMFLKDADVGIDARMVDTETGLVIWSNSSDYNAFDIHTAIDHCVSSMLNSLRKFWPAMVKKRR